MIYKVNDIFYSIQGEGVNTGRAAVFVRFALCNRRCPFCDTDFSLYSEMTADDIAAAVAAATTNDNGNPPTTLLPMVILTGGEPALQVDKTLIDTLHDKGYYIAIETNGSLPLPQGIDWVTVSPKGETAVKECDELKVIFTDEASVDSHGIQAQHLLLQPCDTGDNELNSLITERCIAYVKSHPQWQLSLQTHKLAGFR